MATFCHSEGVLLYLEYAVADVTEGQRGDIELVGNILFLVISIRIHCSFVILLFFS